MGYDRLVSELDETQARGALFSYLRRIPRKPRPWYRRAWDRIDRYLPRVRVSIGPRRRSYGGW